MEEVVKKLITKLELLRKENEVLKARNGPLGEDMAPSQSKMEAHSAKVSKPPHDLRSLMDKYEEMVN